MKFKLRKNKNYIIYNSSSNIIRKNCKIASELLAYANNEYKNIYIFLY